MVTFREERWLPAGPGGQMVPVPQVTSIRCGTRYPEGDATTGGLPLCGCGTFAIGVCSECGVAVCGPHSDMTFGVRLCGGHSYARQQVLEAEQRRANQAAAEVEAQERARRARVDAERLAAWNAIPELSGDDLVGYLRGQVPEATETGHTSGAERRLRPFPATQVVEALKAVGLPLQVIVYKNHLHGVPPHLLPRNQRRKKIPHGLKVKGWVFAAVATYKVRPHAADQTSWTGFFLTLDGHISRFEEIGNVMAAKNEVDFQWAAGAGGVNQRADESIHAARWRAMDMASKNTDSIWREWMVSRPIAPDELRLIAGRTRALAPAREK